MSDGTEKWSCALCTYDNWPASFKCIICQSAKPRSSNSSLTVNISGPSSSSTPAQRPEDQKWTCPQCTYINYPKSRFCTQCRMFSPLLRANMSPQVEAVYPSSQESTTSGGRADKWSCSKCTYDNWFKSRTCVMCKVPRSTTHQPHLLQTEQSQSKRQSTKNSIHLDNQWLRTCQALITEDCQSLEGNIRFEDLDRKLAKQDIRLLEANNPSLAERRTGCGGLKVGMTLVDIAVRFGTMPILEALCEGTGARLRAAESPADDVDASTDSTAWSQVPIGLSQRTKRTPCQACPRMARDLRRHLVEIMRQFKGDFCCSFLSEWHTFALPAEIDRLPTFVRNTLLADLCDLQARAELEDEAKAINWWSLNSQHSHNRLYPLWNRTAGDCLLDSVLQASWGIFDRDATLRAALADSLRTCEADLFPRWRDYEIHQHSLTVPDYCPDDYQFERDWKNLIIAAGQPRESLEQFHVFVLAHILRRPIIIYGIKYVKNFRCEPIGIAHFQGVYLPLLWRKSFCSKNPIVLGYTRGHFTALVAMEPQSFLGRRQASPPTEATADSSECSTAGHSFQARNVSVEQQLSPAEAAASAVAATSPEQPPLTEHSRSSAQASSSAAFGHVYLPLFDFTGQLMPVHFATRQEASNSRQLLAEWLDIVPTKMELPLARMKLQRACRPVHGMLNEWMRHYRSAAASLLAAGTQQQTAASGISLSTAIESSAKMRHSLSSSAVSPISQLGSRKTSPVCHSSVTTSRNREGKPLRYASCSESEGDKPESSSEEEESNRDSS